MSDVPGRATAELAEGNLVSNERYYAQRAAQEASRAARAISPEARLWHTNLAESFRQRAAGPVRAAEVVSA